MSNDAVLVYKIESTMSHPTRRDLDIVFLGGRQCVVPAGLFRFGSFAALVPPGSVVPPIQPFVPSFSPFNLKALTVETKSIGGVVSWGMAVPAPPEALVGEDVTRALMVQTPSASAAFRKRLHHGQRLEPPWKSDRRLSHFADEIRFAPLSAGALPADKWLICPEILDGLPCRIGYSNGAYHVMGGDEWVEDDPDCLYWDAIRNSPGVFEYCRQNPRVVLHGVVCGGYGSLQYGAGPDEHWFVPHVARVDDGWDWRPRDEMTWAPIAYIGMCVDAFRVTMAASGLSGFNFGQCLKKGVHVVDVDSAANSWVKSKDANCWLCFNPEYKDVE